MRNDFCVFILCYNRPDKCLTLDALQKCNYTGDYYIVIGDDDKYIQEYIKNFGFDKVIVFSKDDPDNIFDTMDSFDNRGCVVYARNICFKLAKMLGYKYFCELDDDYSAFLFRYPNSGKLRSVEPYDIDSVFNSFVEYLENNDRITSIAFAQGGDFLGGLSKSSYYHKKLLRKAMNTFICSVDRQFTFNGRINEDVNTYTTLQNRGAIFLTVTDISINQAETQQSSGGMVDLYKSVGTYHKSFYSVISSPQAVKISIMESKFVRIHHNINWEHTAPKIISGRYKKY